MITSNCQAVMSYLCTVNQKDLCDEAFGQIRYLLTSKRKSYDQVRIETKSQCE